MRTHDCNPGSQHQAIDATILPRPLRELEMRALLRDLMHIANHRDGRRSWREILGSPADEEVDVGRCCEEYDEGREQEHRLGHVLLFPDFNGCL